MSSETVIIIDEPYIWAVSLKGPFTIIELSKVMHQQYFLTSNDPLVLLEYFPKITEKEVRRIDFLSERSPYISLDNMKLLTIHLN